MIPRLGLFKATRMNITHMVAVDGTTLKPICIRMPLKHGVMLDASAELTCQHCKNLGWTKSLGHIGVPVDKDQNGRYISRTPATAVNV